MPDAIVIFGAPAGSPDLFHVIPTGIIDPFLYVEADGRRGATVTVLDAAQGDAARASRSSTRTTSAATSCSPSAGSPHEIELELALRALRSELGVERARRAARVPGSASPTTCAPAASSSSSTRRRSSSAAARKTRRPDRRHPPRPGGRRRGDGGRRREMIHGRRHDQRGGARRDAGRLRRARLRPARRRDRLPRRRRPRSATSSGHGPIGDGRAGGRRHLAARPASRCWADMTRTFVAGGVRADEELAELLGAHARVARAALRRWCARAPTAARSTGSRASRSRGRPADPAAASRARHRARRGLLPRARPRRRPRGPRAARTSAARRTRCWPAT